MMALVSVFPSPEVPVIFTLFLDFLAKMQPHYIMADKAAHFSLLWLVDMEL